MPKPTPRTQRRAGNERNIYAMPTCYYMQFQAAGQVYREAFSFRRYGGHLAALKAAISLRDWLETLRVTITAAVENIVANPETEAKVLHIVREAARAIGSELQSELQHD